ncbi:hypothetical protein [Streptomyces tamarix]|uniref:hypothetical protein n=1 Tax=Streptomyces tamarix TaxID=3078565 RepID=UPI003703D207
MPHRFLLAVEVGNAVVFAARVRIEVWRQNREDADSTAAGMVGGWAGADNVGFSRIPTNGSWPNRVEARFTVLRYFTLDGTDRAVHQERDSMIRRCIIWHLPGRARARVDRRTREPRAAPWMSTDVITSRKSAGATHRSARPRTGCAEPARSGTGSSPRPFGGSVDRT